MTIPQLNKKNQYYETLIYQIISMLIITLASGLIASTSFITSALFGGFIMTANVFLLCWSLKRLFMNKSIALSLGVIVFKWAILALFIYLFLKFETVNLLGVSVGISSIILTVLIWIFRRTFLMEVANDTF